MANNFNSPHLIVYTVITNNYDVLRTPDVVDPNITYICFTDEPLWISLVSDTSVWQIKKIPKNDLDPARNSRLAKILPHLFIDQFDCQYSVYLDGNINIIGNLFDLLESYGDFKFLGFKHPFRDCIYQELETCIEMQKDDPETMKAQIALYREAGFPEHYGLIEANVLVRKHHDPDVIHLMEAWWQEIKTRSRRDQLSLPYVAWLNNFQIQTMGNDNSRGCSEFFCARPGWRKTPPDSKCKTLWERFIAWRF